MFGFTTPETCQMRFLLNKLKLYRLFAFKQIKIIPINFSIKNEKKSFTLLIRTHKE